MKSKLILLSLLTLLAAGQTALATTKTVTYTITSIENINLNYDIVFTRSGDAPFDTGAPTSYTVTVSSSAIGQTSGGAFGTSMELADGFKLGISWSSGSNIIFNHNCIYSQAGNPITYEVSCNNANYYVTHVKMTGFESNLQSGMLDYTYNQPIDTDYDSVWNFQQTYRSRYSFGQITVTYSNVPALSIFESAGTDTYNIKDKDDLRHLANYVNGGNNCNGLTFLQTQDITCDDTYVPIGNSSKGFSGTYNGQGKTVSGITVNRTRDDYIGLFGYVYGGTVENVILSKSTLTGLDYTGGIVGYNFEGIVQNCRVESTVTIKAGDNHHESHGGIVGYNDGSPTTEAKVIGCISAASVSFNSMYSCIRYGGIVGNLSYVLIKDCLYTGTSVNANGSKGAILGYKTSGTLTNNYYTSINLGGVYGEDADGARRARTVTLGENVMLVGDETAYDVSGLTRIGTGNYAMRYNDGTTTTLYSGEGQTLTLFYSGTVPEGYTVSYSYNDGTDHAITGDTFTMPAGPVTVTASLVQTSPISVTGHFSNGVYWSTFCHEVLRYALPEGATAYTMDAEHHLYRLGDDGRVIPAGVAVVIIADKETITLNYDSSTAEITDHAPGGNQLQGSNSAVDVSGLSGTPYVLSVDANDAIGFRQYTGSEIPAHKAYYVQ